MDGFALSLVHSIFVFPELRVTYFRLPLGEVERFNEKALVVRSLCFLIGTVDFPLLQLENALHRLHAELVLWQRVRSGDLVGFLRVIRTYEVG